MQKLTWNQTIKLGKNEVVRRLRELKIDFPTKLQYFKLCSLLYKSVPAKVISLAQYRYDKAVKLCSETSILDSFEYINAVFERSKARLNLVAENLINEL